MTESILVAPDLDKKMRIEVDVSDYVTGGILFMEYSDRKWRLVAYLLKNWRHLLEGTKYKFEVWIDYKNLEYFIKA